MKQQKNTSGVFENCEFGQLIDKYISAIDRLPVVLRKNKISVKELCNEIEIARSTFYEKIKNKSFLAFELKRAYQFVENNQNKIPEKGKRQLDLFPKTRKVSKKSRKLDIGTPKHIIAPIIRALPEQPNVAVETLKPIETTIPSEQTIIPQDSLQEQFRKQIGRYPTAVELGYLEGLKPTSSVSWGIGFVFGITVDGRLMATRSFGR